MRGLSSRWLLAFPLFPLAAPLAVFTQSSAADGPWTGQAMCVLSTRGQNYQEDQTHTWRLTGQPPNIVGSIRHWPAVWSVEGSGTRSPAQSRSRAASETPERWSIRVPETSVPIAIWDVPVNRVRIGSHHSFLVAKAIKVVASYPGLTLESAARLLDIAPWTPIIALRTQINGNVVNLDWTCEPGIVEYHVMRLTDGGKQYARIPSIVYPGLCNMSDGGIPPEIGPRGVEYIVVGYDRNDRAVRASRVRP